MVRAFDTSPLPSFGFGLAILENNNLVAVYDGFEPSISSFSVKDINENGFSEFMVTKQSEIKGIPGEMREIQLFEFVNGRPSTLGSLFVGGPPYCYGCGSDFTTCSPAAPAKLRLSFPSNIIYVRKSRNPQFFAEGYEINCDYVRIGVKARKVSSLTPVKLVPQEPKLKRIY